VILELGPGMRVAALEQNVARARSDDRWQIGERMRLGWHREHAGASMAGCALSRPREVVNRPLDSVGGFRAG
jgi:hypothetical protein